MNKTVKIGLVVAAFVVVVVIGVLAFTLPPSGLSIQSNWNDNSGFGLGTLHYEATISNNDDKPATGVQLTLMLFDSNGFIIKNEVVNVGDIGAKSSKSVSLDIQHSGSVSRVDAHLTSNP